MRRRVAFIEAGGGHRQGKTETLRCRQNATRSDHRPARSRLNVERRACVRIAETPVLKEVFMTADTASRPDIATLTALNRDYTLPLHNL